MNSTNISLHQRLQNKILFTCNLVIMVLLTVLALVAYFSGPMLVLMRAATAGVFILGLSLLLQAFKNYTLASYVTVLSLMGITFTIMSGRPDMSADLLYLFISYQVIPLTLSGVLAQKRSFSLSISGLILLLMLYYVFYRQAPIIGTGHTIQIVGSCVILIVMSVLSDQVYLLSGQIMNRYNDEIQATADKEQQIRDIVTVYQDNQTSGTQLEQFNTNSDSLVSSLNEMIQKFTEDMNELNQLLKDVNIRNTSISGSGSNILKVFNTHKEGILDYKDKIDQITETSQDIDSIVQDRKIQMSELIELSTQGGNYMYDSIAAVEKVAENSKNMVDMISLIMEVAEKTNILALNAAVEASRAGKYGGGFAIVAKEIKALSTETTQNADTINRSLQSNITSITEAVTIIKSVGQSFTQLNNSIVEFSSALDQIAQKTNNLTQQNSQMSIETKNTLSLINEVNNVIEKTVVSMEQGQQKVSTIQDISSTIDKDVIQLQQTTASIVESGRKVQEKYREYCYSVKKVETIVEDVNHQQSLHSEV